MSTTPDWAELCRKYALEQQEVREGRRRKGELAPANDLVARFQCASPEEIAILIKCLGDDDQKWFVAALAHEAGALPGELFVPMMNAGIDESNPSSNRNFIRPCVVAFGVRRVIEYLVETIRSAGERKKSGAVQALYWAHPPRSYVGEAETPESRAAFHALSDLRALVRNLLLQTFVSEESTDLRRNLISMLNLDPDDYPDSHRGLVGDAIRIARAHEDSYIRHRVEVQLGNKRGLARLPPRPAKPPRGTK